MRLKLIYYILKICYFDKSAESTESAKYVSRVRACAPNQSRVRNSQRSRNTEVISSKGIAVAIISSSGFARDPRDVDQTAVARPAAAGDRSAVV